MCILFLARDEFLIFLSFGSCCMHIALSLSKRCAFDEILFRLGKLIGEEIGSEYQLAFVCDFCQALKSNEADMSNKS